MMKQMCMQIKRLKNTKVPKASGDGTVSDFYEPTTNKSGLLNSVDLLCLKQIGKTSTMPVGMVLGERQSGNWVHKRSDGRKYQRKQIWRKRAQYMPPEAFQRAR